MKDTQVLTLGWEDPLEKGISSVQSLSRVWLYNPMDCSMEKGMATHYSCLENSMDREDWRATVCGVTKSQMSLSN